MSYELGTPILLPISFRNHRTRVKVDPTAWQVRLQSPLDAPGGPLAEQVLIFGVDSELTSLPAVGDFQLLIDTDRATLGHIGRWIAWVTATGTGKSSRRYHVVVDPPPLSVP